MRSTLSAFPVAGLLLWSSLSLGCKKEPPPKPTREECTQAAEHIADLIMADYDAAPDAFWDEVHTVSEIEVGIPKEVDKRGFRAWLQTPEGQTWRTLRRGQTLVGTQRGIDPCVNEGTQAQVKCLLAAKTKVQVLQCDEKYAPKGQKPAGSAVPK